MRGLYIFLMCFCFLNTFGATINSIGDGAWNSASTWDCSCVPSFTSGDQIFINHEVTYNLNVSVKNSTSINISSTGTFDVGTKNFLIDNWSSVILTIDGGGELIAGRVDFGGDNSTTFVIDGTITTSGDFFFENNRNISLGSTGVLNIGGDLSVLSQTLALLDLNGTINVAGDAVFNYDGTMVGDLTLNINNSLLVGSSSFKIALNQPNINIGTNFTITGAASLDIDAGTFVVGGDFTVDGGAFFDMGADLTVNGDLVVDGGPSTSWTGAVSVLGDLYKSGGNNMVIKDTFEIDGFIQASNGLGSNDIVIESGASLSADSLNAQGGFDVDIDGSFSILNGISLENGSQLHGDGIISWGDFITDNSGSSITCDVSGTSYDGCGGCSDGSEPPANPLNLTTCDYALPVLFYQVEFLNNNNEIVVLIDWFDDSNELDYFVIQQYGKDAVYEIYNSTEPLSQINLELVRVQDQVPYLFRIKQVSKDGTVDFTSWQNVSKLSQEHFTIAPNPVEGNHFVIRSLLNNSKATYCIHDVTGKTLLTGELEGSETAVFLKEYLATGVYFVSVFTSNSSAVLPFFKR